MMFFDFLNYIKGYIKRSFFIALNSDYEEPKDIAYPEEYKKTTAEKSKANENQASSTSNSDASKKVERTKKKSIKVKKHKRNWKEELYDYCVIYWFGLEYYDSRGMTEGLTIAWFQEKVKNIRKKAGTSWGPFGYFYNPTLTSLGFYTHLICEIGVTLISMSIVMVIFLPWWCLIFSTLVFLSGLGIIIWGFPMYESWAPEIGDIGPKATRWVDTKNKFKKELHSCETCPVCSKLKKAPPISHWDILIGSLNKKWKSRGRPSLLSRHPEAPSIARRHVLETVAEFLTEVAVSDKTYDADKVFFEENDLDRKMGISAQVSLRHRELYDFLLEPDKALLEEYNSDQWLTSENLTIRGKYWRKHYDRDAFGWHYIFGWDLNYSGNLLRSIALHLGQLLIVGSLAVSACLIFANYPTVPFDLLFLNAFLFILGVGIAKYYEPTWEGWSEPRFAPEIVTVLNEEEVELWERKLPYTYTGLRLEDKIWQKICPRCNTDVDDKDPYGLWAILYIAKYNNDIRKLCKKNKLKNKPKPEREINPAGVWGEPDWGAWFNDPVTLLYKKVYGKNYYLSKMQINLTREYAWLNYGSYGLALLRSAEKGLAYWANDDNKVVKGYIEARLRGVVTYGTFPAIYWGPYRRWKNDLKLAILYKERTWAGRRGKEATIKKTHPYPFLRYNGLKKLGKRRAQDAFLNYGLSEEDFDYTTLFMYKPLEAFLWDQYVMEAWEGAYRENRKYLLEREERLKGLDINKRDLGWGYLALPKLGVW